MASETSQVVFLISLITLCAALLLEMRDMYHEYWAKHIPGRITQRLLGWQSRWMCPVMFPDGKDMW